MDYIRKEYELSLEPEKRGRKYHHLIIPDERCIPHLKFYVKGFDTSPFGVELMQFEIIVEPHSLRES